MVDVAAWGTIAAVSAILLLLGLREFRLGKGGR